MADTKHLTLLEEDAPSPDHFNKHKEHLLISKIYEKEWEWAYVVDEVCTKYPYTLNRNGDLDYVLEEVEKSIKMWLTPITGTGRVVPGGLPDRKVVNKFTAVDQSAEYSRGKMKNNIEGLVRNTEPDEKDDSYVFTIFFHCREEERYYAHPDCDLCSAHCGPNSSGNRIGPEIHMFLPQRWASFATGINHVNHKEESPLTPMLIGKSGVHRGVLLHEMGHLYGIEDTYYVDNPNHYTHLAEVKARAKATKVLGYDPYPQRTGQNSVPSRIADIHNPTGGGKDRNGKYIGEFHPKSTMSCDYIADKKGRAMLAPDDKIGMWWLYNQVHMPKQTP